jgi:copper(I)-binding protein
LKAITMIKQLLTAALISTVATVASAQVDISDAWVRSTTQGQKATGAFMNLTAKTDTRLVGVQTSAAAVAEIHEMKMDKDVMRMQRLTSLPLPAGKTVSLKPGSYHVMLMGLKEPLPVDSHVQLTLMFEDAKGVKSQQELHLMTTQNAPGAHGKPADAHHNH